jgi:YesN/AraC family two-component response regulator
VDLKLLITDDETLDREGLARQLNWKDYSIREVFIAKDGPSALEILKKNNIDILFSDIKMPLMSGIELAQHALKISPSLQIVFISGYDDFTYAKMAIKMGVYEYILKPVSTEELADCVANLVERIRKQKDEQEEKGQIARGFDKEEEEPSSLTRELQQLETVSDIRQWMKNTIQTASNHLDGKRISKSGAIIEKVIAYVESNYKDNISLDKIAKSLFYTPNYLGNLFKQETKQNFSEYLMEYRIRQAAIMLRDRKVKVLEASMSVGYKNMPTFIKNFKSIYGVTPSEYRKYI